MVNKILKKLDSERARGILQAICRKIIHGLSRMKKSCPTPTVNPVHVAIDTISKEEEFTVIQLGAFVGNTENDPLFMGIIEKLSKGKGKLILVEPVKCFFDELTENYKGVPGVVFENVAISDQSGPATLYRLGVNPLEHGYPDWLSQLGSLKDERMKTLWDNYESDSELKEFYLQNRVQESVNCITFEELAQRHGLTSLDLLQIDVEGFEFEILKTIDFRNFPIRFINYECVLLQKNKANAEKLMVENEYRLFDHGQDTFCYKIDDKHLTSKWEDA